MPERRIGYPGGLFALLWKEGKTIEQQKNRFTDAEMEIAKETDLPDLLESLGYQVRRVGSYHTTKEMDSLRIKNRRTWFRYSEGVGGDAITFLQRFCGKSFPEAVEYLLDYHGWARDSPAPQKSVPSKGQDRQKDEPPPPFALPLPNTDQRRVFAYLQKRGIAPQVIRRFIQAGLLYEDAEHHAVETEAADGFKLDDTPIYFTVKDGETTRKTVTNKAFSGILIHKVDPDGHGIPGVTFLLYDSGKNPIGQYTSDNRGYVYIEDLTESGRYYLRELENEGYVPDTELKTVYVKSGRTTEITWENIPITGQIQIIKKSADYNPTTGLPAGTLLEGAIFEIYDRAGNLVDTIRSDSRGLAVSKQLPLSRYTIREVKAPNHYGVNETELTAYLEHEGQIVRFEVTNKSLTTGVSITKTGPKEIMGGQPVRYTFSGIANTSNVRLDSFYWRDTIPAQVRLDTVITGTYNFPGTYKITYRVNGGEYRTLADNLSTSQTYTLAASPAALGLASNERVTEIMFVFGQAPAGFAQVETPYLNCTAVANLPANSSFVNIADVGGVYNGTWVQAISRWVTTVYGKPTPLPRTGY